MTDGNKPVFDPEAVEDEVLNGFPEMLARSRARMLQDTIYVAIRTAPKHVLSGLRDKNPTRGDAAAGTLADIVTEAVERKLATLDPGYQPSAPSCGAGNEPSQDATPSTTATKP